MDQEIHPGNRVTAFFVALVVVAACTTSVSAQVCEGSVAHAVQVMFADCGNVPDNVSVYIGNNSGSPLALSKALSAYWEADKKTFEPADVTLCSHTCSSTFGCARFSETVAINRGDRRVCAARYVIQCTEQVWNLRVETDPGRRFVTYKRLGQNRGAMPGLPRGSMTPLELCDLALDEQVEIVLKVQGSAGDVLIPLKPISVGSFVRGTRVDVNRDELARRLQTALRVSTLTDEGRELLPKLVTFKLIEH